MMIYTAIATGLMVAVILLEHLPGCISLQLVIGDGQDPSTCNFSALLNASIAVSSSSGEHQVLFNCSDKVVISFDDQIELSGRVIVDGQHQVTLDGKGFFRQLSIGGWGSNVTLMSLVVANGGGHPPRLLGRCAPSDQYCSSQNASDPVEKYDGGCLYASSGGILALVSVTFTNCSSIGDPVQDPLQHANDVTYMGGAIYADFYTTVFISNSTFVNNTALHEGGAIYKLLPNFSTFPLALVIWGSVFEGNSALSQYDSTNAFRQTSGGGAIYSWSSMLICNSLFLGNSAEMLGGAVRSLNSDIFIDNSIFINNTVISTGIASIAAKGGAIHAKDTTTACNHGRATIRIMNSLFVSNEAPHSAGALCISLDAENQTVIIGNTSFVASKVSQNSSDIIMEPPAAAMSLSCSTSQFVFLDGVKFGFSSIAEQRTGLEASVSVAAWCIRATGSYANISSFVPGLSAMDDDLANEWLWKTADRDILEASLENNEMCSLTLPLVPCPPPVPQVTITRQKTTIKPKTSAKKTTKTTASTTTTSAAKQTLPTSMPTTLTSVKLATAMVNKGVASGFACQSVWNRNSADSAFDGDKSTCYVSGMETTSWWMMTLRQAMNLSRITLTGHIDGDVVLRFGDYYDPLGRPCLTTAINPVVSKQTFRGEVNQMVIDFASPTSGVHLSLQANRLSPTRLTICEIAFSIF